MLKDFVLDLAYYLDSSSTYQKRKLFFYNVLENEHNKYKRYVDIFLIFLILVSVTVLIREVKFHVSDYLLFFSNYVVSLIFLVEYLLRLWVTSSISKTIVTYAEYDALLQRDAQVSKALKEAFKVKLIYMVSPQAIIDLFAIMPFFHELRLFRLFILFRVFKLFRYAKSIQVFASVLATKRFEFLTLGIFSSVVIFISTVLIYVMEANQLDSQITSMYRAFYWTIVTISTVGYGDITPVSNEGKLVAIFVITSGIAVLAFTTSLFVSAFTEKLDEIREVKTIEEISKIKKFYLICGYGSVANTVAKKLKKSEHEVIVMDKELENVDRAKSDGFTALNYNPGSIESYKKLNIDLTKQIKYILCLHEDDVENVYAALTIRSINKNVPILSLVMNDVNRKKLEFIGIDKIVSPQALVGLITKELVGVPVAFEVIHGLRSEHTNVKLDEIGITQKIVNNFATIGEIGNKEYRVILLGIFKNSEDKFYFHPKDDTILEVGDYLLVIGYSMFITEFEKYLHTKSSL